ncbi:hypothetical protein GVAV_001649 [Gurleya vavrai]
MLSFYFFISLVKNAGNNHFEMEKIESVDTKSKNQNFIYSYTIEQYEDSISHYQIYNTLNSFTAKKFQDKQILIIRLIPNTIDDFDEICFETFTPSKFFKILQEFKERNAKNIENYHFHSKQYFKVTIKIHFFRLNEENVSNIIIDSYKIAKLLVEHGLNASSMINFFDDDNVPKVFKATHFHDILLLILNHDFDYETIKNLFSSLIILFHKPSYSGRILKFIYYSQSIFENNDYDYIESYIHREMKNQSENDYYTKYDIHLFFDKFSFYIYPNLICDKRFIIFKTSKDILIKKKKMFS